MATVNFSIPDDIKNRFNKVFAHKNKSHLITELMQQSIDEYERRQQRIHAIHAIDALLELGKKQKPIRNKMIRKARKLGRL
jgi:metal-responsive CopG/Arc/MetJ family transcriptional regulator